MEKMDEFDPEIRDFIILLNQIESVETFSSCSGHSGEAHINFRYNKSSNLKKVLEFFKKHSFGCKLGNYE